MMSAVLYFSNHHRLANFTGMFAATLVALYITFEAQYSGMSINPARSFGSALSGARLDVVLGLSDSTITRHVDGR